MQIPFDALFEQAQPDKAEIFAAPFLISDRISKRALLLLLRFQKIIICEFAGVFVARERHKNPGFFYFQKPIFAMDFQNDGEIVGGCIAGGRRYLHINANGDCDPCVFIHYSDSNIREKTLLECLRSPMFMAYHDGQPFNDNHLRPCPMLKNPEKLRQMVETTGAKSTDMQSPESAEHLCAKCDAYASNWAPTAEKLWQCSCACKAEKKEG